MGVKNRLEKIYLERYHRVGRGLQTALPALTANYRCRCSSPGLGVLNAAAAESVEMDLCLQNLEEYVFEEQKLVRRLGWILVEANLLQSVSGFFDRQVTYRWLSAELKVPANTAKK